MDPYYDIHSWSRQYNQEMLREVRTHRLEKRLRTNADVDKDGVCEGGGLLSMRRFVLISVVVISVVAAVMTGS